MRDQLDADLAQTGEWVTLRRMARTPAVGVVKQVSLWMVLSGYQPSDMVQGSGITQEDQRAIFSPTLILAAGWPSAGGNPVPARGDRVQSARGLQSVIACSGRVIGGVLVRIEAQLRGM